MTDRHAQAGGNPAAGSHPDNLNPTPAPAAGNDFPDSPDDRAATKRPQDKPDPDAFAARLGLRDDASPIDDGRDWRSPVSKTLRTLSTGAKGAARRLHDWSDRVVGSGGPDEELDLSALRDRVSNVRTVMLSTIDERGTLSSRPLTVQKITDHGDVWFVVDRGADWMSADVQAANVAFTDDKTWVSVSGRAIANDDPALLDDLWNPAVGAFFPDGKSAATVLQVQSDRWEYWAAPNKIAQLVEIARATVGDGTPDLGDSGAIET